MKKTITLALLIVLLLNLVMVNTSLAFSCTYENFEFEKSVYNFKGEGDTADVKMQLPYGYELEDVEFYSENEDVARVEIIELFRVLCFIETKGIGETRIWATIPGTNYRTYCTVKVENPINLKVEKENVGVTVTIESSCSLNFSLDTLQAVEIKVEPINNPEKAEWVRLGVGVYAEALNATYTYYIEENCNITVRQVCWWTGERYDGIINEIATNTTVVDNIEPISSIGANIHIYQKDNITTIEPGKTVKLDVDLVEMSNNETVTWKSYDEEIAEVDENGNVYAYRESSVIIEASVVVNNRVYRDFYTLDVEEKTYEFKLLPIFGNLFSILVY